MPPITVYGRLRYTILKRFPDIEILGSMPTFYYEYIQIGSCNRENRPSIDLRDARIRL